jgi:hypothetical protein
MGSVKHYLFVLILTMLVLVSGCEGFLGQTPPTEVPFARFTAQDVFDGFSTAGLPVQAVARDMLIGREAPSGYRDRYVFEISRIAPQGGQVLIFDTPEAMGEWLAFIESLRADRDTRRDVAYVYSFANVLLQVNANLLPEEANAFRAALFGLGAS